MDFLIVALERGQVMAVRIPWDKYEAAILLDACLRVDQGVINRSSAITYVSNTLRNRAVRRGLEIDAIFRNENGISMQFSAMANCLHHGSGGLTISKIFRETIEFMGQMKSHLIRWYRRRWN